MHGKVRDLDALDKSQIIGTHHVGHWISKRSRQCGFPVTQYQEWGENTQELKREY